MRTLVTLLAAALLAACAAPRSTHEAASIHGPLVYSCEDGLTLRVRFAPNGAFVDLPSGEQVCLPRQSAGGESYAGGGREFTQEGGQASWKTGRQHVPVGCRVQR